ncbi:MAG: hypothetical protein MSA90_04595 [Faecalicatena sp.]|uniref:hypothetical protein n=1 Tax=Faecalicatena sp. TaxID=2005360 RepID=UPI0025888B1D|nr:hypothetical protein [Faecalicatena sp.]MCI6464729.1 hypothetical protein [Faecalicatena sp.]MDY5618307.1 hypothetical protein [Lachnospiraceae bacterium]
MEDKLLQIIDELVDLRVKNHEMIRYIKQNKWIDRSTIAEIMGISDEINVEEEDD